MAFGQQRNRSPLIVILLFVLGFIAISVVIASILQVRQIKDGDDGSMKPIKDKYDGIKDEIECPKQKCVCPSPTDKCPEAKEIFVETNRKDGSISVEKRDAMREKAKSKKPKSIEAPVNAAGQLVSQHIFSRNSGRAFYNLAKREDVHLVLELGTGLGDGFSTAFGVGLAESGDDKLLITVEHFEEGWRKARDTLRNLPVHCLRGSTVPVESYLTPEEIPEKFKDEHYKKFYKRDIEIAKNVQNTVLNELCRQHNFDAVLLDGNEYTGFAEYEIVKAECKPKYLALHDVGTLKTHHVEEIMKQGRSGYILVAEGAEEDSGLQWAVFVDEAYHDESHPVTLDVESVPSFVQQNKGK